MRLFGEGAVPVLNGLLRSLRVGQWTKNGLLFGGLIFAGRPRLGLHVLAPELARVVLGFLAFCLLSSATYLLNDVCDVEQDRLHPKKRHRPVAAGVLPARVALAAAIALALAGFGLAWAVGRGAGEPWFCVGAVVYFLLTSAYSLWLKHLVIVDVLVIALGFVLRVTAGCLAVPVQISPWIILCTLLLSLFLGLCKRRHELILMDEASGSFRKVLPKYSAELLDQMIGVATSATVMSYCLYTFTAPHKLWLGRESPWLMLTIPFVIYGLFRYLYLAYRRDMGGSPELMFTDRPLALCLVLWVVLVLCLMLLPGIPAVPG
ncbi:MAG: decaprenyl-phosphate phosphoribosyltransferase [Armatimonadetes bacterium CG_4_10_14_3_um_filter_66_18]|nr:decaprenyl-phosphate phosphoribosyltransferase [Armatimonadota bacterium]OIP05601.1 MAG: hypothetical protein AUJ96_10460 [Armatimonadetes bacterium CG2_30_66_41]PIU95668.1 MAG: decaprenyl-phosphate phosphoribosyltransferase [Armatimonadetes bacterium CG06_land_8_20_14_3_00_66_21]PIW12843.1 MAG: decaprenyl-phosphate phosphoribosyltransferase [Armatimonadetes bacterium CG17_big_fil_post_rev_8_21_14_2_50_66_6]PIX42091.1 MAG: decaprenyl-phosphate phosphoribosyltransferase [Armatimonadetes bacte